MIGILARVYACARYALSGSRRSSQLTHPALFEAMGNVLLDLCVFEQGGSAAQCEPVC
jgi:hypothetical protein